MKRRWVFVSGIAAAALVVGGVLWWWHVRTRPIEIRWADVVSVRLQPVPEGPVPPAFERRPTSSYSRPLSLIENAIPAPLPGPGVQPFGCQAGGDLIIQLADGRSITYGPCRHPGSIRALWARIEIVLSHGRCTRPCAPPR